MSLGARRNRVLVAAASAAMLAAFALLSPDDEVDVDSPSPTGKAAQSCRELNERLPEQLLSQHRVPVRNPSRFTAAWGDPAIVLRCGAPRPDRLSPDSADYDPLSDAVEVNSVTWLFEEHEGGYRFTTTDRATYVEVTVPSAHAPETGALPELAKPIRSATARKPL
ncbi:DUF3515 domain-containing protein [Streptomyces sp. NPDC005438]|uniref:DUF3515 domain-containing protein n=1 Tax=Streptomyces sp. NPDC005438 TaxID=3156880 RepID=UPI0033B1A909